MSDRTHYSIREDSPVLKVIEAAIADHDAFRESARAFAREFGAARVMSSSSWTIQVLGLVFDGPPPKGWRNKKDHAVPDGKTKLGRDIKRRMRELPLGVSAMTFSSMLHEELGKKYGGDGFTHWADNKVYWSCFERFETKRPGQSGYVVGIPTACRVGDGDIPGAEELKMSEYWALKEADEAAKKADAA